MASITVGITYHDEGHLLTECLTSLRGQSEQLEEILVFDDASGKPADRYVPRGLGVQILRTEENVGPGAARNRILKAARGSWIHFHDADDLFCPDWAEAVLQRISKDDVDAVFTEVRSTGLQESEAVLGLDRLPGGESGLLRFCLRFTMLVPAGTYRTEMVRAIGGYPEERRQSEDMAFHVRLAAALPRFTMIPRPLVHIRVRQESRSQERVVVWRDALSYLRELAPVLPDGVRDDVAGRAAELAGQLIRAGDAEAGRECWAWALSIGRPDLAFLSPSARAVARAVGLPAAEWLARLYRETLPNRLRVSLRRPVRRDAGLRQE